MFNGNPPQQRFLLIVSQFFLDGEKAHAIVGILTTYLSDNPAILTLAEDNNFRRFFKKYQLPALTNIGTSFGMGLIITTCMIGLHSPTGEGFGLAVLVGNLGAIIGSIVSTRLMLNNGMPEGGYTGSAYEGIALLPWLGEKLQFLLLPLFGFSNPEAISVPITALGAAGAAIGMVERLVASGLANAHDVAVFTSMCMCWSGYLSTHVAMMDTLKCHNLTGKALLYHTIGGLCAGISANWLYLLLA